jgi:hypothetical protein
MKCRNLNQILVVCEGFFWVSLVCELLWNHKMKPSPSSLYTGPHFTHKRTDNSWQKVALITQPLMHAMNNIFPMIHKPSHPTTKSRFDPSTHCMLVIIHSHLWNEKWTNAWLEFANSTFSLIWTRSHVWIWLGRLEGFKLQRRSLITNSRLMVDENLCLVDHASFECCNLSSTINSTSQLTTLNMIT